jgi:hypothetical protein
MYVCHKCDVPSCINPDHLWLGSPAENAADMRAKGRSADGRPNIKRWGELSGVSKLSDAAVGEIRSSRGGGKALAEKFGIHPSTVSKIRRGVYRKPFPTGDAA